MTENILWGAIILGEIVCCITLLLIIVSFFEEK
jgi:hypothetical protein